MRLLAGAAEEFRFDVRNEAMPGQLPANQSNRLRQEFCSVACKGQEWSVMVFPRLSRQRSHRQHIRQGDCDELFRSRVPESLLEPDNRLQRVTHPLGPRT